MKRRSDDSSGGEDAEMDVVDAEEKMDPEDQQHADDDDDEEDGDDDMDDDDDDDQEGEAAEGGADRSSTPPFLDTFYGLASSDPAERVQAGHDLLNHCLTGPNPQMKDAAYALKRLLRALCSGRAAARQGNASVLVTFLKIASQQEQLSEILQVADGTTNNNDSNDEKDVQTSLRDRLLKETEPETNKGSEVRDALFGRLFGILAIVKSGILTSQDVSLGFAKDLIHLYNYPKKWMREPAAHAICMLLNFLKANTSVLNTVVKEVIIPDFLTTTTEHPLTAEQLAVTLLLQGSKKYTLPFVLNKETLPAVADTLSSAHTESETRTHLVWDVIWTHMAAATPDDKKRNGAVTHLKLRTEDGVYDLLEAIVRQVIVDRLLGTVDEKVNAASQERRVLALCLVRTLLGMEFLSSITGRTCLETGPQIVETSVLQPVVIKRLFLDVLSVRGKGHALEPMSSQALEFIVGATAGDTSELRMPILRALLQCDPRFDSRTKTNTVEQLLLALDKFDATFWNEYVSFLESQLMSAVKEGEAHQAIGYVDLMFQVSKLLTKRSTTDEADSSQDCSTDKAKITKRLLQFFLVAAFFDCQSIQSDGVEKTKSKKDKKKKKRKGSQSASPIVEVGLKLKSTRLPYEVRSITSARFFSVLTELVNAKFHSSVDDKENEALTLLAEIKSDCADIEQAGGKRFGDADESMDTDEKDTDEKSPEEIVQSLHKYATKTGDGENDSVPKKKFVSGMCILASVVELHLLSCGQPDSGAEEDPDKDDDEDKEEIKTILSDLYDIFENYQKNPNDVLLALAELCTNVLSSPLGIGNQSRGASPTLLRHIVKVVWTRALSLVATLPNPQLDPQTVSVVLQALGIDPTGNGDEEEAGSDDGSESEEEVADDLQKVGRDGDDEDDTKDASQHESDDEDVELDPAKLHSLLEEEIDEESVEGIELEHHEGADAALAKLIQLKQDARKAGQKARERLELARRLRCAVLLETLVSGKPEGWGVLLRVDTVLQIAVALLRYNKTLAKAVSKATEQGADATLGEKRTLSGRVSTILKTKVLKMKVAGMKWSDSVDAKTFTSETAATFLQEARTSQSKEQQAICSSAILLLIRVLNDPEDQLSIADMVYADAVDEWATKRTTQFEAVFLEQVIHHSPVVAQASLAQPLVKAAAGARSSFLKSESFRIFGLLYNPKLSSSNTVLDKLALARLVDAAKAFVPCVCGALEDADMKKTKRLREVLKTTEKVFGFLAAKNRRTTDFNQPDLQNLSERLNQIRDSAENAGVKAICDKIIEEMSKLEKPLTDGEQQQQQQEEKVEAMETDDGVVGGADAEQTQTNQDKKSAKAKKKKQKKKR